MALISIVYLSFMVINARFLAAIVLKEGSECPLGKSSKNLSKAPFSHSSSRFQKSSLNPHPFMNLLYQEVSKKENKRWREMDALGEASIRGIEPTNIQELDSNQTVILTFISKNGFDFDSINHVDLVLKSCKDKESAVLNELASNIYSSNETWSHVPLTLKKYRLEFDYINRWSFLVFDLTFTLKQWWAKRNVESNPQTICLQFDKLQIEHPMLVFYNVNNHSSRSKRALPRKSLLAPIKSPSRLRNRDGVLKGKNKKANNPKSCRMHTFDVSLQDIKWDLHVLAPFHIEMNYCAGSCEISISDNKMYATNNSIIRGILNIQSNEQNQVPKPVCVPVVFQPYIFMLLKNEENVIEIINDIVVEHCGCG